MTKIYWYSSLSIITLMFLGGCHSSDTFKEQEKTIISSTELTNTTTTQQSSTSTKESTITTKETQDVEANKKDELNEYLLSLTDQPLGIYLKDLETNESYGVNEDTILYGASIAKLPIIYYTQMQINNGSIKLTDTYPYTDVVNQVPGAMLASGTGIMQQSISEGALYSVEDLFSWSILHSDNLASNMLSYYVGKENGTEFLTSITPFYPEPLTEFSKNLSAKTAGDLMEAIYLNKTGYDYFLNTDWQNQKLDILPTDVYHKIGINNNFNHDVGIVSGDHPYVFAFLSNGLSNEDMETIIQQIDLLMKKE